MYLHPYYDDHRLIVKQALQEYSEACQAFPSDPNMDENNIQYTTHLSFLD